MAGSESPQPSDSQLLDDLFERAVAACADGERIDVAEPQAERPDLAAEIEATLRLAREVTPRSAPAKAPDISGYELVGELGRGAMGVVYLARDEALGGRLVALKVLRGLAAASSGARERFAAEARALARLRHPGIVSVHAVVDRDDLCAYSMEWVEGCTLAEWIQRQGAGEDGARTGVFGEHWLPFVCRAGIRVARALAEAHRAGLVHRDVKASNILIRDGTGEAMLSDFGLARHDQESLHTRTGAFVGTIAYAAPEQVAGRVVDARADIYGLGVTMYQCLALRLPYQASTAAGMARAIEDGLAPSLGRVDRSIPRALQIVVHKAMAVDAADRYQTADELARDLERVLDLRPVMAVPPSRLERVGKWLRRNRVPVLSTVAGASAVLVVGLGVQWAVDRAAERSRSIDRLMQQAQFELLDAELRGQVALVAQSARASHPRSAEDAVVRATATLDRALAIDEARVDVLSMRSVLEAARATWTGAVPDLSGPVFSALPVTTLALRGDFEAASDAVPSASARDLAALGLGAYLRGSLELATAALEQHRVVSGAQAPFLDGLLGQVLLARGHAARAYPRLLRLARSFPQAGSLQLLAADAAIRCGDRSVALRLLAAAQRSEGETTSLELLRLQADLAWLEGRVDEARAAYSGPLRLQSDGYLRLTQIREAAGDHAAALRGWANQLALRSIDPVVRRGFLRCGNAWWARRSAAERRRILLNGLGGSVAEIGSVFGILHLTNRVERDVSVTAIPPLFGVHPELSAWSSPSSLSTLARTIASQRPNLSRCGQLPLELRERVVDAWLRGEDAGPLLRAHDARLAAGAEWFVQRKLGAPRGFVIVERLAPLDLQLPSPWGDPLVPLGDLDGDGCGEFALHSLDRQRGGLPQAGQVRVHSGRSGAQLFALHGEAALERVGYAMAAAPDCDGDGLPELLVGSAGTGSVPGFAKLVSGRDQSELARVTADVVGATFGHRVACLAGPNRQRLLVVASPGADRHGQQSGRVLVMTLAGELRWVGQGAGALDSLGESLAVVGDLNGDGWDDLCAGGNQLRREPSEAVVWSGADGEVLLRVPGPSTARVAGTGDFDGDLRPDLAVAWPPHAGSHDIGRGAVVSSRDGRTIHEWHGAQRLDGFGEDIASLGDLDGDGRDEIAVSVWSDLSALPPSVHIYRSNGEQLAVADGWWRLRRLRGDPIRLVGIAFESWSRYASEPLGQRAQVAVFEPAPDGTGR